MRFTRKCQKLLFSLLFVSFILCIILGISLITDTDLTSGFTQLFVGKNANTDNHKIDKIQHLDVVRPFKNQNIISREERKAIQSEPTKPNSNAAPPLLILPKENMLRETVDEAMEISKDDKEMKEQLAKMPKANYRAHVFYYPWYGNPKVDGNFIHWNHPNLPHWDKKEAASWPKGKHKPPDDIGSNFYPQLGPYSSRDATVLESHMQQIRGAGIGVLAVSWYPPGTADENGLSWDDLITPLMDHAHRYELKVCFHIEPFKDRNRMTLRKNLEYIIKIYGSHPAFYKYYMPTKGKELPLFYLYDSYLVGKDEWGSMFLPSGENTVRGTDIDGVFIGLFIDRQHRFDLVAGGFDGFYTYFASDGFTFGSTTRNWPVLKSYASKENMLFIPSVGPGYNDVRVRPWNARNTKQRENGGYYEQSLEAAVNSKSDLISITSFNEWHEGTQIEKAIPKSIDGFKYSDYQPMEPDYYLSLTRKWLHKWNKQQKKS